MSYLFAYQAKLFVKNKVANKNDWGITFISLTCNQQIDSGKLTYNVGYKIPPPNQYYQWLLMMWKYRMS